MSAKKSLLARVNNGLELLLLMQKLPNGVIAIGEDPRCFEFWLHVECTNVENVFMRAGTRPVWYAVNPVFPTRPDQPDLNTPECLKCRQSIVTPPQDMANRQRVVKRY